MDDILRRLVDWMGSSDGPVVTICVGILLNLTCNNQRNKKVVCHSGGIDRLLDIIYHIQDSREEIVEHAVSPNI